MARIAKRTESTMSEVKDLESLIDGFGDDILDKESENIPPRIYELLEELHDQFIDLHKQLDKEVHDLEGEYDSLEKERDNLQAQLDNMEDND